MRRKHQPLRRFWAVVAMASALSAWTTAQVSGKQETASPKVQVLLDQGDTAKKSGNLVEAVSTLKKAQRLANESQDTIGEALAYEALGLTYQAQKNFLEAVGSLNSARPLFIKARNKTGEVRTLTILASAYQSLDRLPEAVGVLKDLIDVQLASGDKFGAGQTSLSIAALLDETDSSQALKFAQSSLATFADLQKAQWTAVTLTVLGSIYGHLGDHGNAVDSFTQAVKFAQIGGHTSLEGEALTKLGAEYEDAAQFQRAYQCYQDAFQVAQSLKNKRSQGMRLVNLGVLTQKVGLDRIAQSYFAQAIQTFQGTGDLALTASAMQNLGVSYQTAGQDDEARKWLEEALQAHKSVDNKAGVAGCLGAIGSLDRKAGAYVKATENLKQAASIFHQIGAKEDEATAQDSLGSVLYDQGKFQDAISKYDLAINIYDGLQSDSFAATSYGNKADALYRQGRLKEAQAAFEHAVDRYELVRTGLGGLSDAKTSYLANRVHVYQQYANVLTLLGKANEAFDIAQKTKARSLLDLLASDQVSLDSELTPEERETEQKIKSKADYLNARMLKEGVQNEVGAKARYAALATELKQTDDEFAKFTTALYSKHPGLANRRIAKTASTEEIGAALPDDTALVEFVFCEDAVVSLVLRKENGVVTVNGHSRSFEAGELEGLCDKFKRACSDPKSDYSSVAEGLYDNLFSTISDDVKGKSRLIVCPDACLWDLPFAALKSHDGSFLSDKFEIDYAYSATGALAALQTSKMVGSSDDNILVCANPDFGSSSRFSELTKIEGQRPIDTPSRPIDQPSRPIDQPSRPIDQPSRPIDQPSRPIDQPSRALDSVSRGLETTLSRNGSITPLPGSQREADGLRDLFPKAKLLTGLSAQETEIKSISGPYKYLHFATHGFLNDASPLQSCIVLAQPDKDSSDDGFLTARELYSMKLKADMVVLSACNTAKGEVRSGEGIIGLTWALFVAGCKSQVVSQWSVDDASTATLMVDFYSHLSKDKLPKGAALNMAAKNLRKDPKYSHPYYWAPFIMVGDWR